MKTIGIITPTYNRAKLLPRLYQSLCKQTCFDFSWYIVDDGSTDNTLEVVRSFEAKEFAIKIIKKSNGGKHTALTAGLKHIGEELVFIVDSDDWLAEDAIEAICKDWQVYKDQSTIAGLSYYKMYKGGQRVSKSYPGDHIIDTHINMRINNSIKGDCAEVIRRDVLELYPFPEIAGERFLSEAVVWNAISEKYKMVYVSKGVYFCEYQSDGLSSNSKRNQIQNPLGTMLHAKAHLYRSVRLSIRLKYACMYIAISRFAKINLVKALKASGNRWLCLVMLIPGFTLYFFWKRKYSR